MAEIDAFRQRPNVDLGATHVLTGDVADQGVFRGGDVGVETRFWAMDDQGGLIKIPLEPQSFGDFTNRKFVCVTSPVQGAG